MSQVERHDDATERVLGGSPVGVVVRLLILSFVVGVILSVLDINPNDVINWVDERFRAITSLGFDSVEEAGRILLAGAVIVVPVWLFVRVLRIIGR